MTTTPLLLSVNIDHVATLRQARRAPYPDPVDAAAVAEDAGAGGITVHLRVDRRHIQDDDVRRLRPTVRGKLNLEISTAPDMLEIALETRPHQVTLVPERPDEVTTEGGLDLGRAGAAVRSAAERLRAAGLEVSLFLDPEPRQLDAALALGSDLVPGFEINTDAYTRATLGADPARAEAELDAIRSVARRGAAAGLRVFAGHGLTTANVGPVAGVPEVEELNIGHWLVSRGALVGLGEAVREMRAAITAGRAGGA